uniref:golgin subfamily A member 2-like n=1 Tax=Jaculus jaculus TaxID=51337 RepID=UPI001E1B27A0|nr:golgin subfamily A member 2-like [Jaculus jaculus]
MQLSARQQLGRRQEKKGWWKFFGSLLNTANQPTPGRSGSQDGSTSDQHGNLQEVRIEGCVGPEQGKAVEAAPHEKPTAQLLEHLEGMGQENLPGQIDAGQNRLSSCDKPCIPFFYKDYDIIII